MCEKKIEWCTNCVSMSTRPRISFNESGWCNACQWSEEKKALNWEGRQNELKQLLNKYRRNDGNFDCLVPVSGGKDGSYVAYNLKHKYNMNPLTVTVTPALPLPLGEQNLKAFVKSGYNHISIDTPFDVMRTLNKTGFVEMGFPYYGWLIAIHTAVMRIAVSMNIGLVFYGEDGEVEYGGSTETSINPICDAHYQKKIYLEGGYEKVLEKSGIDEKDLYFFRYPTDDELERKPIALTHWSYFENWDPYRNYIVAKEQCGLSEANVLGEGTFNNFAQNDQALYSLHAYLMYLKFGFGRANQDACIEVRSGRMKREEAVEIIKLHDGTYPERYLNEYLDYYQMTKLEFDEILDRWVNRELFDKVGDRWVPNFEVK